MGTRDPRVDAYIARSQKFAKPILTHIRAIVHSACPHVEETMKWGARGESAGSVGKLTSVKDLPGRTALSGYIRAAMRLNDESITVKRPTSAPKPEAKVPKELAAALAKNRKAKTAFEKIPPSQRREYCEWIDEAKREETKAKRVTQAVEWIAEGKLRNWRYQR